MDPELISALNRIADAHSRLADNVGRLADSLKYTEDKFSDHTFAEALMWRLQQVSHAIETVADKLPEPPEED